MHTCGSLQLATSCFVSIRRHVCNRARRRCRTSFYQTTETCSFGEKVQNHYLQALSDAILSKLDFNDGPMAVALLLAVGRSGQAGGPLLGPLVNIAMREVSRRSYTAPIVDTGVVRGIFCITPACTAPQ